MWGQCVCVFAFLGSMGFCAHKGKLDDILVCVYMSGCGARQQTAVLSLASCVDGHHIHAIECKAARKIGV